MDMEQAISGAAHWATPDGTSFDLNTFLQQLAVFGYEVEPKHRPGSTHIITDEALTQMREELKAYKDAEPKVGFPRGWEVEYDEQKFKEAQERARVLGNKLWAQNIDPVTDKDFLRAQMDAYYFRSQYLWSNARRDAKLNRTHQQKRLGQQYGLASRTIYSLRGEVALLLRGKIDEWNETMADKDNHIEVLKSQVASLRYQLNKKGKSHVG